jgi:hypothetical protein
MGVDYSGSRPSGSALKAAGVQFVVRYLAPQNSATQWKLLTASEARGLLNSGEHVVSNFEWYETRCLEGFNAGVADAHTALAMHNACGGDPTAPILFSADTDTTGPAVEEYFRGTASVLGVARNGVYGEYSVCKYLIDKGIVGKVHDGSNHYYAWQTYAWSGGAYEERCCLSQDHNGATVAGASVDIDHSHSADYGQWGYDREDDDGLANISQSDFNKLFNAAFTAFLKTTESRQLLLSAIFRQDGVLGTPASELAKDPKNTSWWGVSFLQVTIDLVNALTAKVDALTAKVSALEAPTVDETALAAQVKDAVKEGLSEQEYDVTPKKAA